MKNILVSALCQGVLIVTSLICLIFTCLGEGSLASDRSMIEGTRKNWNEGVILDIIEGKGMCPQSYYHLYRQRWLGTYTGCNCLSSFLEPNAIEIGECTYNQTIHGCETVGALPEMEYRYWKGVTLCAKRSGATYLDFYRNAVPKGKTCKNAMKPCGILDSVSNILCVDKNEECPVLNLEFLTDEQFLKKNASSSSITLGNRTVLTFNKQSSTSTSSTVNVDTLLSQGAVCLPPSQIKIPALYILERSYSSSCSHYFSNSVMYDTRYHELDSYSKENIYRENNILDMLHTLPNYPFETLHDKISIFSTNYVGWKLSCMNSPVSPLDLYEVSSMIEAMSGIKIAVFIFSFLSLSIVIGWTGYMQVKDNSEDNISIGLLIAFFILTFIVTTLSIITNRRVKSVNIDSEMKFCGDDITYQIIMDIESTLQLQINYYFYIWCLGILNFGILFAFLYADQ